MTETMAMREKGCLVSCCQLVESFRFEGEDDWRRENEIWLKVYSQKIETPESVIAIFFTQKVSTVICIEGG